jgi:hypothetical protein
MAKIMRWLPSGRPRFKPPIPAAARAVTLEPLFQETPNVQYVDADTPDAALQIRDFRPAALCGGVPPLLRVAAEVQPFPTHAVVVLTREGEEPLSEPDRDRLWDAYRVPAFEQMVTREGKLLAWECEAHDGLHVASPPRAPMGRALESRACACGKRAPRLMA